MGLAEWWLTRRAEAAASSCEKKAITTTPTSRWSLGLEGLRRAKSEPRKLTKLRPILPLSTPRVLQQQQPLSPQEDAPSAPTTVSPSRRLGCERLSASVSQAKELLQQCAAVVSQYPSLVPVPSVVLSPKKALQRLCNAQESDVSWAVSAAMAALDRTIDGLNADKTLALQMTSDGCGGAYLVRDATMPQATPLAVFKPRDEEYMAPKNPRGYVKEGAIVGVTEHPVNKGFRVGNGALRERAAFLLDEAYGNFSGVPVTTLKHLTVHGELKEGSVQAFVPSECSAEDMGTLKFSVPEVHKIGILDVRLFNTDRHAGNVLLAKQGPHDQTYAMTPIDHGFCLPSYRHLDSATFDWLQWPQAQYPFTSEELDHIAALDIDRDAAILRSLGIEEACITTMRLTTMLLQIGAEAGFSLFEIGSCLQRDGDFTEPSPLEAMVATAVAAVRASMPQVPEEDDGIELMDAVVEEVERAVVEMFAEQPKKKVRSISCFS